MGDIINAAFPWIFCALGAWLTYKQATYKPEIKL